MVSPWLETAVVGHEIKPKRCTQCGVTFKPTHGNAAYCSITCYMSGSATPDPETGCLLWNGSVDTYGYGHARWLGKRRKAHVMAFELAGGALLPDMVIRHLCNNARCCNPQHLKLGTRLENMADKARSGIVAGEKSPHASLTNSEALAVYELRGEMTAKEAATKTGVSKMIVLNLWNGQTYTSVTGATRKPKGRPLGEANPAAKISNKQAKEIYALKGASLSAANAARRLGVPSSVVWRVWKGVTHSQITGAKRATRKQATKTIRCLFCSSVIEDARGSSKWCSLRCALVAHVAKGGPDECWLWTAKSKSRGYGQVQFRKQRLFAHHVALDLAYPEQSLRRRTEKLTVSHRCHVSLCCNPSHLELMTLEENVRQNRGRSSMSGERNTQTKLSADVAARIIKMINAGERSIEIIKRIKQEAGATVTMSQVTDIRRGRSWKSLSQR